MKKFISVSPHQKPEQLNGYVYAPNDPVLEYGETAFPMIPVINAYAKKGDRISVITVVSDYENSKINYERFKSEVEALAEAKGFECEFDEVSLPFSDDVDTCLEMFEKLIDRMSNEDTLYADLTYGTKVMPMVINMSLNYGYRIHKDVSLGCIVYGKVDHNRETRTSKAFIYDITSLNYMDEIVRVLAEAKIKNPKEHIKRMLK